MSQFVTRQGNQLMFKGLRYRYVGFNSYNIQVDGVSQAILKDNFGSARKHGINEFRLWCFDRDNARRDNNGNPQSFNNPTATLGNFRYITDVPVGNDVLENGSFEPPKNADRWTFDPNFTLSTNDPHSGIQSIEQNSVGGFQNLTTSNDIIGWPVLPNTTYTLKYWRKSSVAGQAPLVYVNTGNAYGSTIATSTAPDTGGAYVQASLVFNTGPNTKVFFRLQNNNGTVHAFYDDFTLGIGTGKGLAWYEPTLAHLDLVLDEARKKGMKLTLTLFDSNNYVGAAYPSKITYDNWANQIYGLNLNTGDNRTNTSTDFFRSIYPRQLLKDFVTGLANRVNTINGRLYKTDDTIKAWELGNETRFDSDQHEVGQGDTNNAVSVNWIIDWIKDISAHIKSVDPNHLIVFGGCENMPTKVSSSDGAHNFEAGADRGVSGDHVYIGSYNGINYKRIAAECPDIDILSFHSYPNQGLGSSDIHPYGLALGYVHRQRGAGYRAQMRQFVIDVKALGKAVEFGEIGYAREDTGTLTVDSQPVGGFSTDTVPGWPMYPRIKAFKAFFEEVFDNADCDGVLIWSATARGGGSFSVGMDEQPGIAYWGNNENKNDADLMRMIGQRNTKLVALGKRSRVS